MSSAEFRAAMLEVVARAAEVRESFADEVQARRDAAVSARLVSGDTEGLLSALPSRGGAELRLNYLGGRRQTREKTRESLARRADERARLFVVSEPRSASCRPPPKPQPSVRSGSRSGRSSSPICAAG